MHAEVTDIPEEYRCSVVLEFGADSNGVRGCITRHGHDGCLAGCFLISPKTL